MGKPAWKAGDTCTIKPSRGHVVPKIRCGQLWTIDSLNDTEACVHNGAPGMVDLPRVPGLTCAARVPLAYLLPPGDAHPTIAAEMGAEVLRLRARVAELEAANAELLATLANERGEGEAPVEGWVVVRNPMGPPARHWWWERHLVMVYRAESGVWTRNEYVPERGTIATSTHDTARAAMRAASSQGADVPKEQ